MARFIAGNELNFELTKIFKEAKRQIIIISPFIRLHHRFKDALDRHLGNPDVEIVIVFGKNEVDPLKSFGEDQFKFFSEFYNVEINYEPRLHAKYYANEQSAIITSMNLYDFSQDKNLEVGIITESKSLSQKSIDKQALEFFTDVIANSKLLFKKEPVFSKGMLGLTRKFIESKVVVNDFNTSKRSPGSIKRNSETVTHTPIGYCIRTGVEIPFDIEKPFSPQAYTSWNRYANPDYPEKFCHFSGEESHGETSMIKPILKKNWDKAKKHLK